LYVDQIRENVDIECFLVFGNSVPEGRNVYVGRKNKKDHAIEIWDPTNGECYFFEREYITTKFLCLDCKTGVRVDTGSMDQICPLKTVSAVVTQDNVYVNLQIEDSPSLMYWDFSLKKYWTPFLLPGEFETLFPDGLARVDEELKYETTNDEYKRTLETKIQKFIANKIEEERRMNPESKKYGLHMNWDFKFSSDIKELLREFETFKSTVRNANFKCDIEGDQTDPKAFAKKRVLDAKQRMTYLKEQIKAKVHGEWDIYGFPLNMPYVSEERIWEEIKNTEIHNIFKEEMNFALTVAIYTYPHYIMSVWVYVAVMWK